MCSLEEKTSLPPTRHRLLIIAGIDSQVPFSGLNLSTLLKMHIPSCPPITVTSLIPGGEGGFTVEIAVEGCDPGGTTLLRHSRSITPCVLLGIVYLPIVYFLPLIVATSTEDSEVMPSYPPQTYSFPFRKAAPRADLFFSRGAH